MLPNAENAAEKNSIMSFSLRKLAIFAILKTKNALLWLNFLL